MVVGGHEKVLNIVLLNGLHPLDALAAAVLASEIVHIHPLDISQMGHGNHRILIRNQVFHGYVVVISNGRTPVIPVFVRDNLDFLLDYGQKLFHICQDCL